MDIHEVEKLPLWLEPAWPTPSLLESFEFLGVPVMVALLIGILTLL